MKPQRQGGSESTESLDQGPEFKHIRAALRGLRFGTVTIVVQDGRIVQIERNEKTRLKAGD